jgi:hypothetical protein
MLTTRLFNIDKNGCGISSKEIIHLINCVSVLVVKVGHLRKDIIGTGGEVELFVREFVVAIVGDGKCYEIILIEPVYLSPKEHLVSGGLALEALQSQFKLHSCINRVLPFFEVESETVLSDVTETALQIQNVHFNY